MRDLRVYLIGLFILLLACGKLDMVEARYRNNVKEYDALIGKSTPPLKTTIETSKQAYVDAHGKLPEAESERIPALKALNDKAEADLKKLTAEVEAQSSANAAAQQKAVAKLKTELKGTWQGQGMTLRITDDDKVHYERKGSVNKSLTGASLGEVKPNEFTVSLLALKTTFRIDSPPTEKDGVWTMKVDGVELTRVAGPSGERALGTFTCRVLVNENCVDHTTKFPANTPTINASHRSTSVPSAGTKFTVKWIAADVSGLPKEKVMASVDSTFEPGSEKADFVNLWSNVNKPEKGFLPGSYRVEVHSGGSVVGKTSYEITPAP